MCVQRCIYVNAHCSVMYDKEKCATAYMPNNQELNIIRFISSREPYAARKNIILNQQVGRRRECYSRGGSESFKCVPDGLFLKLGVMYRVFILFLIPPCMSGNIG